MILNLDKRKPILNINKEPDSSKNCFGLLQLVDLQKRPAWQLSRSRRNENIDSDGNYVFQSKPIHLSKIQSQSTLDFEYLLGNRSSSKTRADECLMAETMIISASLRLNTELVTEKQIKQLTKQLQA